MFFFWWWSLLLRRKELTSHLSLHFSICAISTVADSTWIFPQPGDLISRRVAAVAANVKRCNAYKSTFQWGICNPNWQNYLHYSSEEVWEIFRNSTKSSWISRGLALEKHDHPWPIRKRPQSMPSTPDVTHLVNRKCGTPGLWCAAEYPAAVRDSSGDHGMWR